MARLIQSQLRAVPAGQARLEPSHDYLVGIHQGAPVRATCESQGVVHRRTQVQGDIDIVPAGAGGVWTDEAPCSVLFLRVEGALVERAAEGREVSALTRFQVRDPQLEHLAWALHQEQADRWAAGRLYRESLSLALASRLLTLSPKEAKGLSPRQLRDLREHIHRHLDQDLSLAELASVAGLGESQLKLLFKQSVGTSVHRYVLQQRVERAQELILRGVPLSEVALDTGFAHQSHLAQWTRRLLGLTPKQIRLNLL